MNTPSMYSVDQLLKARQNGVPDYVVVPMLQKAMAQKQAMAQQQALQQGMNPPPPVADQILDAAHNDVMQEHMARRPREEMTPVPSSREETKGIDSLPSGIDESDYAHGGIIAFARGGSPETGEDGSSEDDYINILANDPDHSSATNAFGGISVKDKNGRMVNKHWDRGSDSIASELDLLKQGHGIPLKDNVISYYGNDHTPEEKSRYLKNFSQVSGIPLDTVINKDDPDQLKKIAAAKFKLEQGLDVSPESMDAILAGKPYRFVGRDGKSVATNQRAPQQGSTQNPTGGIASLAYPSAPEDQQQPYTQEETTPAYEGKRLQDYLGEDPNMAKREARLAKREADLSEEKDRSPWMALMQAGLSTMAGTSPNAFANIGAGASEGLKAYGEARKDLSKSSDKLMDLRGEIEDAQYAHEQAIKTHGWDSAEANKKANLLVKKENQKAKWDYKKDAAEFELKKFEAENKGNLQTATADFYRQKPEMEANKTAAKLEGKGEMTPAQKAANELALERTANANLSKNSDYSMATPEQQALMKEQEIAKLRAAQQGGGTAIPLQSNVGNPNYNVKNYFK